MAFYFPNPRKRDLSQHTNLSKTRNSFVTKSVLSDRDSLKIREFSSKIKALELWSF